jgi:hypothetical protein
LSGLDGRARARPICPAAKFVSVTDDTRFQIPARCGIVSPTVQRKGTAAMADHKHGEMDVETQEKTFEGFMRFSTKTVIFIIVLLVLMAIFIT